jgi:hypothetical protein
MSRKAMDEDAVGASPHELQQVLILKTKDKLRTTQWRRPPMTLHGGPRPSESSTHPRRTQRKKETQTAGIKQRNSIEETQF